MIESTSGENSPEDVDAAVDPGAEAGTEAAPPLPAEERARLEAAVIDALHTVYDPEIPVDIYELGLIYEVRIADDRSVVIDMTLTSPSCPAAESLPPEAEGKAAAIEGITKAEVRVVWDPTWTPDLMSEAAKLDLGMW